MTVESFGNETFLSEEVAINILQVIQTVSVQVSFIRIKGIEERLQPFHIGNKFKTYEDY